MQGSAQERNGPVRVDSAMALDRCLVEADPKTRSSAFRTRGKTFGASLIIEVLLLGALLATPLLSSARIQVLTIHPPPFAIFGALHGRISPQKTIPMTAHSSPAIPNPYSLTTTLHPRLNAAPGGGPRNLEVPDIPGEIPLGPVQVIDLGGRDVRPEPPQGVQPTQPEKRPLKISEGVLEAQLISRVEPQYPLLARETRTEGAVKLHAIVGRDGRITSLEIVSGHPLLVKAALDAVRQWRYNPTMLNGEPVEVETSITVIFRLHE
jgi:protein TonB